MRRVEASSGYHGNQPASLETFPWNLDHSVAEEVQGEVLSLYLQKSFKQAHYDESGSERE